MKRSGAGAVIVLALVIITGLSVMYCKDVGEKMIALTFDVAGGEKNIGEIMEILEEKQIKAAFFVTGQWVEQYPEEVKRILEAGHELGNSGENHREMTELSAEECRQELMRLHEKVKDLTGYTMELFRPPYGAYNRSVIKTARECGYRMVCWDIDSMDWKNYGADDIVKCVTEHENLGNGAVILCRSNSRYISKALGEMLEVLKSKGYEMVPVSEMI